MADLNLDGERTCEVAGILERRGASFMFVTGYGADGMSEAWRDHVVPQKAFEIAEFAAAIKQAMHQP